MKSINLLLALVFAFSVFSVNAQSADKAKTDSVKVWGNCGMCKARIEKAAVAAGASSAKWDSEMQMLTVSFDNGKATIKGIEEKVAAVGHDTQNFKAKDDIYSKLHGCCQYERKSNNIVGKEKLEK